MIGDIIMNVSEKIRYYRELRGLTQQQLADFSGIPLGTLKKYETGNRNPKQEREYEKISVNKILL